MASFQIIIEMYNYEYEREKKVERKTDVPLFSKLT